MKKELKMYSIKELEEREDLVIYLGSEKEHSLLKNLSNKLCCYNGQHCYSLHKNTFSSHSNYYSLGSYKNASIITIKQIKELNMENKKEIIGYKLIKPEYNNAVINITNSFNQSWKGFIEGLFIKSKIGTITYHDYLAKLIEAGVLDLWFEPVYKENFKVGDWVYSEKTYNDFRIENYIPCFQIKDFNDDCTYARPEKDIITGVSLKYLRLATKKEIEKATEKVYTLGINETFEIIVKNKRAFYGSEDVTETLQQFKDQVTSIYCKTERKIGKYVWCFKDVIVSEVGCIKKESYVSQWLKIKLN